jgi:hypothetical protein
VSFSQQLHKQPILRQSKLPIKKPPSAILLHTVVNKEVEQQFSGRGMIL